MARDLIRGPDWPAAAMTDEQLTRWTEVLNHVAGALPPHAITAVIDAPATVADVFADHLTATLRTAGRPCSRLDATPASDGEGGSSTASAAHRVALAARHGRTLSPDEPLAVQPLRHATHDTGWHLSTYDDPPHRFLAIATRR